MQSKLMRSVRVATTLPVLRASVHMPKTIPKQAMVAVQQRQYASNALMMSNMMTQKAYYKQNFSFTPLILPMLGLAYYLNKKSEEFTQTAWCHPQEHGHALSALQAIQGNEDNKIRFFGSPQEIFKQFATK